MSAARPLQRLHRLPPSLHAQLPVVAACAGILAVALLLLGVFPNAVFEDDAYFYFQIARNILVHGASSFDGLTLTNGYHPLWMGVLVVAGAPLAALGVTAPAAYGAVFVAAGVLVWGLALSRLRGGFLLLGAVLACYCGLAMESPLAALALMLAYDALLEERSPAPWVLLAVATRPDMAVAVLPLLVVMTGRQRLHAVLATALGLAAVAAFHWMLTGYPYSVSSSIKASSAFDRSVLHGLLGYLGSPGHLYRLSVLAALNALAIAGLFFTRPRPAEGAPPRPRSTLRTWVALGFSANAFVAAHLVAGDVRDWHFAPSLLPLLFLCSVLFHGATRRPSQTSPTDSSPKPQLPGPARHAVAGVPVALAALGLLLLAGYLWINRPHMRHTDDFLRAARRALPAGTRVFAYDGSGFLAWKLADHAHVIDGDGLCQSFAYRRRVLIPGRFREYLREHAIGHAIVNHEGQESCPAPGVCLPPEAVRVLVQSRSLRPYTSYSLISFSLGE